MTVTLEQAMDHVNADDDEKDKIALALKHAQSMAELEVKGNDGDFKATDEDFYKQREDLLDRVILQNVANFYTHASGDAKQNATNSSSEDALLNYTRVPSVS